jgi:hypothetical protein
MEEQNPPPLAVHPTPNRRRTVSAKTQRLFFLLGGIVIGAALVMASMRFTQPQTRLAFKPGLPERSTPADSSTPQQEKKAPTEAPKGAATPTKPDEKWDPTKVPFNPFDASLGRSMPPKEITGHIEAGPMVAPPTAEGGPTKPPVPPAQTESATPKGLLLTMRLDVSDPNSAVKSLQGVASKVGGAAIQFDESAAKPDAEGAILFVSSDKFEEALKLIEAVGSVVVSDKWTGSSLDRIDRIERAAEDRLSELRIQRQELLIKYFEDAPEIRHIEEDAGRISKCVAALRARKPGPSTAVIKIKFLT